MGKDLLETGEGMAGPGKPTGVATDHVGQAGPAAKHHHPGGTAVQLLYLAAKIGKQRGNRRRKLPGVFQDNGGDFLGQGCSPADIENGKPLGGKKLQCVFNVFNCCGSPI
jgi:hypothetical protein